MPKKVSAALLAKAAGAAQEAAAGSYPVPVPSEVLPELPEGAIVAIDTETSGLFADDGARVSTVSVAWMDGEEVISYGFPFDQGMRDKIPTYQSSLFEITDPNLPREEWEALLDWLTTGGKRHVYHNAPFDLEKLRVGTRHWPGRELLPWFWWDTQVGCRQIWPLESTSLKPTAVRLWGPGEDDEQKDLKNWLRKNKLTLGDMDKAPWDIIGPYATKDTHQTIRLVWHQLELVEEGFIPLERLMRKFAVTRVLYSMTKRGLGYDAAGSLEAADILQEKADAIATQLPFTPTVPGAKKYFFETLGELPTKMTKPSKTHPDGQPSLDDEVVAAMVAREVPNAAMYADYVEAKTAIQMWYRGWPEKIGDDGRLRTTFRQNVVVSERFSVERVQLQAIPKDDKGIAGVPTVRSFVKAKEGHELWNLDLSQAELRVASEYSDCKKMKSMLLEGADLHGITCQDVLGVYPDDPNFKYHRDIAKRLTFGGIFQVGAKTFQGTLSKLAGIHLPLAQCDEIVRGWRRAYPEFGYAYRNAEKAVESRGYVRVLRNTEYEQRSYFGPRDFPNTGWNRVVQGSLAQFVQLWLVEAERQCQAAGYPDALVLTVHDSLVLELPEGDTGAKELVESIANWAAARGTELFQIDMLADVGPWHK